MELMVKGLGHNRGKVMTFPTAVKMPKHIEDVFKNNDNAALIPHRSLAVKFAFDQSFRHKLSLSDEKIVLSNAMNISYMQVAFEEGSKAQLLKVYSEPDDDGLYKIMRGDLLPFLFNGRYIPGEVRYIMPYSMAATLVHLYRFETEIFNPRFNRAFGILSQPAETRLKFYYILHPARLDDPFIRNYKDKVELDLVSGRVTHTIEYDNSVYSCSIHDVSDTDGSYVKKALDDRTECFSMMDAYRMVSLLISENGILNYKLPDNYGAINELAGFLESKTGETSKVIFSSLIGMNDAANIMYTFKRLWRNFFSFGYNCLDIMPSSKVN